jgi:hypothetical protein
MRSLHFHWLCINRAIRGMIAFGARQESNALWADDI